MYNPVTEIIPSHSKSPYKNMASVTGNAYIISTQRTWRKKWEKSMEVNKSFKIQIVEQVHVICKC